MVATGQCHKPHNTLRFGIVECKGSHTGNIMLWSCELTKKIVRFLDLANDWISDYNFQTLHELFFENECLSSLGRTIAPMCGESLNDVVFHR